MNNEQEIIDMYVKLNKSTYEISKHLKTYPNKIRRVLAKHGIKLKDRSEAQKNALKKGVAYSFVNFSESEKRANLICNMAGIKSIYLSE